MKSFPVVGRRLPFRGLAVRTACVLVALLLNSSTASADPIRIVTSGFFGSGGDDTGFWVEGLGFYLQTGALPPATGPVVMCEPCTPGTSLNLSSNVTVGNWGAGTATIDGQFWSDVYYSGTLTFSAGSVVVPDVSPQPPGLDETVVESAFTTFSFTGMLIGFSDPSLTGSPLFTAQIAGGGSGPTAAWAGFGNLGSGVFLDFVDYNFDDVAPTPEPGSLLLFGSGAAWIAARSRKRRPASINS